MVLGVVHYKRQALNQCIYYKEMTTQFMFSFILYIYYSMQKQTLRSIALISEFKFTYSNIFQNTHKGRRSVSF